MFHTASYGILPIQGEDECMCYRLQDFCCKHKQITIDPLYINVVGVDSFTDAHSVVVLLRYRIALTLPLYALPGQASSRTHQDPFHLRREATSKNKQTNDYTSATARCPITTPPAGIHVHPLGHTQGSSPLQRFWILPSIISPFGNRYWRRC